uniref:Uncharacterized protein n=1 Tax=Anopheles atroparvus TaxID=41427 RepID=A0AAG5DGX9_ANOAO
MKKHILDNLAKLMCACVVMKIEEFTLFRVTTSGNKQMPKEFVAADRDRVPPDMATLHAEFTYFYYPGDFVFPLPPSKAFVHINPVQVHFHLDSFLWLSSFVLNLHESLLRTSNVTSGLNSPSTPSTSSGGGVEQQPNIMYMDVKVECIMPRLIFEGSAGAPLQRDRPKAMHVEVSRFALTNIRETGASRADLAQAISSLQEGSLVFGSGFPSKPGDLCIVTDRILSHIAATDVMGGGAHEANIPNGGGGGGGIQSAFSNLTRYATWREPRDVWCMKLDPVWVEFYGARSIGPSRAIPFVDAVPVTIWVHGRSDELPPELIEPPVYGDASKQRPNDNNFNSNKSSESSLILSVNSLKQSLDLSETPLGSHWKLDDEKWKRLSVTSAPVIPEEPAGKTSPRTGQQLPPQLPSVEDSDADNRTADLHVIAHVSNLVSVQIDHYQYLFLLRLAEELTEMATFLSLDSKRILQAANTEKSIVVGCVIPQVEVSLVMPSQTPGKESSGGDGESVMPDSASLGSGWPNSMDQTRNSNIFSSTECPSPIATEPPVEVHHISNPNTHGHNVQIQSVPTTSSTSGVVSVETPSSSSVVVVTARTAGSTYAGTATSGGQQQQQHAPLQAQPKTRNSNTTPAIAIGTTTDSTSFSKELNSGLSSMKKGFSHFMTSIDSALKTNTSDDISDTLSVQSDISSDSELQRVLEDTEKTTDCMDAMFRLYPFGQESTIKMAPIEVASEVCEDPFLTNMSSPSDPSESSSLKRRDLVSMVTFRLTTVEVIRQNVGSCSSLRLQMSAISCDECGAIPWDEFQVYMLATIL